MSKYKDRATELFSRFIQDSGIHHEPCNECGDWIDDGYSTVEEVVVKAMCQLAEEVEHEVIRQLFNSTKLTIFSKEQVEKLLERQRELCAEHAKSGYITTKGNIGKNEIERLVDKNSILNAKLEI